MPREPNLTPAAPSAFRFGDLRFDEGSGEIRRAEGEGEVVARLTPQPARLLAHLIRRAPEVVGADEIRELLWPDVKVEYEQSLHTCIRQIRAALGDSAGEPRYVETLPRRGYRFLETATAVAEPRAASETSDAGGTAPGRRRSPFAWGLAAGLLIVLLLAAATLRNGGRATPALERPSRIAVMPFEPTRQPSALAPGNDIAESVVKLLVAGAPRPEVIGPTTTARFADPPRLRELFTELEVDYLVNGRETVGEEGPRLLVEVIRAADGAHVWARYLDEFPGGATPAETIALAVAQVTLEDDVG